VAVQELGIEKFTSTSALISELTPGVGVINPGALSFIKGFGILFTPGQIL